MFLKWATDAVEESDRRALSVLHTYDYQAYRHKRQAWAVDRILNMELTVHNTIGDVIGEPDLCASSAWRKKMVHFASASDLVKLLQDMLEQDATLLEAPNSFGQTPLMIAFQSGSFKAAKYLLQQGANLEAQDLDGISTLHWLISFPESEKMEIAPYLHARVTNVDVIAPRQSFGTLNFAGAPDATGTPLHWGCCVS